MRRYRRPNTPTLPQSRVQERVPYSNEFQPDIRARDQPPVEPERQVRPFVVSAYDAKPLNAEMFYEPFTGVAVPAGEEISSAAGNLVFGASANGFQVPRQRRFIIRGVNVAFFSGDPNFYTDTPYGIAPGFIDPALGGASWSLTVNGNPVPGAALRAIVGGPGEVARVSTWVLVEETARVSIVMRFRGGEVGAVQTAVYGDVWGDDLLTSNVNLPYEPTNVAPIAVEG